MMCEVLPLMHILLENKIKMKENKYEGDAQS